MVLCMSCCCLVRVKPRLILAQFGKSAFHQEVVLFLSNITFYFLGFDVTSHAGWCFKEKLSTQLFLLNGPLSRRSVIYEKIKEEIKRKIKNDIKF